MRAGDLLKYNRLWRAGMHYSYVFFVVTHVTSKGTPMGRYVAPSKKVEQASHDTTTIRWRVDPGRTGGAIRRLPHPGRWEAVTEEELEHGVVATSCVY
tara:strand:+ start:2520 stop:2813 length:294 start_codon:yes stop_codon:yes gene_type:complete